MTSPFPGQGPMGALSFVFAVITLPHPTEAKTGAAEKASVEPRTVKRSRTASGVFGECLSLKTDRLIPTRVMYGLGRARSTIVYLPLDTEAVRVAVCAEA